VQAWERGVLYGLVIWPRRGVPYRDVDPALCRELFIREGLVAGEIAEGAARPMKFLAHNLGLVAEIERLEHKTRRPDVLVDETLIEAFYDSKIPADVVDLAGFEHWRKQAEKGEPKLLYLTREQLMRHEAGGVTSERFPPTLDVLGWTQPPHSLCSLPPEGASPPLGRPGGRRELKLDYRHEPGDADDGVTLTVPLAMLNQVSAQRCEWLVPGLLEEKVTALLKTVPQKIRHRLQPLSESAAAFAAAFESGELRSEGDGFPPLLKTLQHFVEERVHLKLPLESFRPENLFPHCFMNFRVIDEHGRVLGQSRQLSELRARFKDRVAARFEAAPLQGKGEGSVAAPGSQPGFTAWTFGKLPELLEVSIDGHEFIGFPALRDDGDSVSLRPFDTPEEAARVHRFGLRRLFILALKDQVKAIERLPGLRDLALQYRDYGNEAELKIRLVEASLARCCLGDPLPEDEQTFTRRCQEARPRLTLVAQEFMRLATQLLVDAAALQKRLTALNKAFPDAVADLRAQIDALLPKDFLTAFEWERLAHFPRYLKAMLMRLDKLRDDPARDLRLMLEWKTLAQPWQRETAARARDGVPVLELESFRWLLEELRVSLFAQTLKTPMPVSTKRLQKIWESRQR
jgi:ATP-dependent helicase HrpA